MFQAGSLKNNLNYWKQITRNETVLNWIEYGVKLPFVQIPDSFEFKNRKFSNEEALFIDQEIKNLLQSKSICRVNSNEDVLFVSPINVVPKKKGLRLVTDLRHLNSFIKPPAFVYSSIDDVLKITKNNDQMVTWDLEQGFLHIPVHESHSKYLCFQWKGNVYKWLVTPFGGNFSPYFFCKTIREVIKHLRINDLKTVAYVDDFYLCDDIYCIEPKKTWALGEMNKLGWHINFKKSALSPKTERVFIGFLIKTAEDNDKVWLCVPKERITRVIKDIKRIVNKGQATDRALARLAGQIVSMTKAVSPAKLLLRNLYRCLKTRQSWQDVLTLDCETIKDLNWWLCSLSSWNGKAVQPQGPVIQIATDASAEGWGATMIQKGWEAQGFWTQLQSLESSNFREIQAIFLGLLAFLKEVTGKTVHILSDNVAAVCYINMQGGPAKELSLVATKIWSLVLANKVTIKAYHLQGRLNVQADMLSRLNSQYEWCIHQRLYYYLDSLYGPHTIDRFATMSTTQCVKYNSRFMDPKTSGVNALAQGDWAEENNFVNPPIRLLDQTIDIICQQGAYATIIAPAWKSQWFYHRLKELSIYPPIKLPKANHFCITMGIQAPEPLKNLKWTWFAWRVYGKKNY